MGPSAQSYTPLFSQSTTNFEYNNGANSQGHKRQDGSLSLNTVIEATSLARDVSNTAVTKVAFGSVGEALLAMVRILLAFFPDVLFQLRMCPGVQG